MGCRARLGPSAVAVPMPCLLDADTPLQHEIFDYRLILDSVSAQNNLSVEASSVSTLRISRCPPWNLLTTQIWVEYYAYATPLA